jgi:nucleoside-diphosphate-sugar epimerase
VPVFASIQEEANNPGLKETDAYPAGPDSEYGWEKLFSERMYMAYARNFGIEVHIARFHNIFGLYGTWEGGREKAPAAMCRKVAETPFGQEIEIGVMGNRPVLFCMWMNALKV